MTEYEDYFKCRDCTFRRNRKDKCCCTVDPDDRACDFFLPKKEVKFPIERELYRKIYPLNSGESITFSRKEIEILLEALYKDICKELFKTGNNHVGE